MTLPAVHILGPTSRDRPFQRINIPGERLVKLFQTVPGMNIFDTPISGRGYDCGCRSTDDYDGKIGKELGEKVAEVLEKVVPIFAAAVAVKAGFAAMLKGIPLIGPKLSELVDGFDPLKSLLGFLGENVDAMLVDSLVRSIPAWVPVFRALPNGDRFLEAEVEGVLVRSHQRHDGVPYTQWHRWYDWSFLVSPVGSTAGLTGTGNLKRTSRDKDLRDDQEKSAALDARRYERGWMPLGSNLDQTLSCEWDLGALAPKPGPFLNRAALKLDWGWPMAGQFFWASGRNVYDCSHATSDQKSGPDAGLHLNQLRPIKAIATLRWEGFLFEQNRQAVPAAQFLLFASNAMASGGDFRFDTIHDVDWEFVVQLPPGGALASDDPYAVGSSERFKLNTLDIGRRLLVKVDITPFLDVPPGSGTGAFEFNPVITPLAVKGGDGTPTHVRIKFPMSKVSDGIQTVGAIVSLGWHDPSGALARRVHKVTVTFRELEIREFHESGEGEWIVNLGVNGRWFQRLLTVRSGQATHPLADASVALFLSEDDVVQVAAHGLEQDGQGDEYELDDDSEPPPDVPPKDAPKSDFDDYMNRFLASKKLRFSKTVTVPTGASKDGGVKTEDVDLPFVGEPVDWRADMDQPLAQRGTPAVRARASEVARALFLRNARIAFDANDLIGLVDPNIFDPKKTGLGRSADGTDTPNPLAVKDLLAEVGLGGTKQCVQTAYVMTQLGRMGMIAYDEDPLDAPAGAKVFHAAKIDYILRYDVKLEPQPPPPAPAPAPGADSQPAGAP